MPSGSLTRDGVANPTRNTPSPETTRHSSQASVWPSRRSIIKWPGLQVYSCFAVAPFAFPRLPGCSFLLHHRQSALRLPSVFFALTSRLLTYRHAEGANLSSWKSRASKGMVYYIQPPVPSPRLHTLSKADRTPPSLPANSKLSRSPYLYYSASLKIRDVLELSGPWPAIFQISAPVFVLALWHADAAEAAPSWSYPGLTASVPSHAQYHLPRCW